MLTISLSLKILFKRISNLKCISRLNANPSHKACIALQQHCLCYWCFVDTTLILDLIFKMYPCPDFLLQNIRKSGFGASDELSSEEEEGLRPVEVIHPLLNQERHPVSWPASASVSSVRKRNLKSNPKSTLRPQVIIKLLESCVQHVFFFLNVQQAFSCYSE